MKHSMTISLEILTLSKLENLDIYDTRCFIDKHILRGELVDNGHLPP